MGVTGNLLNLNLQVNTTLEYSFTRINGDVLVNSNNSLLVFYPSGEKKLLKDKF